MANDVWDIKSNLQVQYYASGAWTSVQAETYEVEIDRGIMLEKGVLARTDIGTARIELIKPSLADFVGTPAYKPNMPIRVRYQPKPDTQPTVYEVIFYGYISSIFMGYDVTAKKLKITIQADDSNKILSNTRLSSFSITGTTTNRSFRNVIDSLGSAVAAIDTRFVLVQDGSGGSSAVFSADTFTDVVAGEVLNQLTDAELGWCYSVRSSGTTYYMTRADINTKQSTAWSGTALTVSNQHSSSVDHICMDYIDLSFDTSTLVNSVKVIETSSTPASDKTSKNTTSITDYGEWPADFEITMDPGASPYTRISDWASHVSGAAEPKQIRMVSVPALRRDGTVTKIAYSDVGQTLQVEFVDPANTSNKIQQVQLISRIRHSITADHWEIDFHLWKGI
jgi:hypothetical protein